MAARRGAGRVRPDHAHARHGRRRRPRDRRSPLPRLGRARAHRRRRRMASRARGTATAVAISRRVASGLAADRAAATLYGPGADAPVLVERARAGDAGAIAALAEIGRLLGAAIGSLVNIFDPGRRHHRRRLRCGRRRSRARARARSPRGREAIQPADETLRIVEAELGDEAGLIGAGARRVRGARRRAVSACRSPSARRRSATSRDVTLRVLEELARGGHRALRGHAPHARSSSSATGSGRACSRTTGTTRRRAVAELVPRLDAGERIALVSDAGLPGVNDPGARLVAAALAAGVAGHGAAGPVGRRDGARRERPRGRAVPVRRVPPAAREERAALWAGARRLAASDGRVRIAEAAAGNAREPRGGRARPAGRGLPRADEGVRGGRLRARRPSSPSGSASRRRAR